MRDGLTPNLPLWELSCFYGKFYIHTLMLKPEDASQIWIKFANLCQKSDGMVLAEKTLESLLSSDRVFQTLS